MKTFTNPCILLTINTCNYNVINIYLTFRIIYFIHRLPKLKLASDGRRPGLVNIRHVFGWVTLPFYVLFKLWVEQRLNCALTRCCVAPWYEDSIYVIMFSGTALSEDLLYSVLEQIMKLIIQGFCLIADSRHLRVRWRYYALDKNKSFSRIIGKINSKPINLQYISRFINNFLFLLSWISRREKGSKN
jgi:hypothetical protein